MPVQSSAPACTLRSIQLLCLAIQAPRHALLVSLSYGVSPSTYA
ncbi:hypothetical protein Vi05172_g13504 [Venturia inaequalis]|nr:hypothetical protein Vi05172_g13504 [Venturia inaequalis]